MEKLERAFRKAEKNLNQALVDYENSSSSLAQDFSELKLQACIFQFDICSEVVGLVRNQADGFAALVSLKVLVLRLFEYDKLLNGQQIPKMIALSKRRGIQIDLDVLKGERKKWCAELNKLQSWSSVRNEAAHYGKDLSRQIQLMKTLSFQEVMKVNQAFLHINMIFIKMLRDAGASNKTEC